MDPHFNEYLAAVAGMVEVYGDRGDDHPTEFHDASATGVSESATVVAA
jgi:hypothetical protein